MALLHIKQRFTTSRIALALSVSVVLTAGSCKRRQQPAPGQARSPGVDQVTVASTHPTVTRPSLRPSGLNESDFDAFIAATPRLPLESRRAMEPSPAGFDLFAKKAADDGHQGTQIARSGITMDQWTATGRLAWAAWSRAQVGYNQEAPLRENEAASLAAHERLKVAELTARQAVRKLSETERAVAIASADEDERSARSRAATWHEQQVEIQQQIASAQSMLREPPLDPSNGGAQREDRGFVPSPIHGGILPDGGSAPAFIEQRRHDLQSAMLHEADELHHAEAFAAIGRDPTLPANAVQKLQLTRHAQSDADQARSDLKLLADEHARLLSQVREQRRISAEGGGTDISPSDVKLVEQHIGTFNALWGRAPDGQPIQDAK